MKDEITIPVLKVEDVVAAANRRENYSLKRDIQAKEFNDDILSRMERESEKPSEITTEDKKK